MKLKQQTNWIKKCRSLKHSQTIFYCFQTFSFIDTLDVDELDLERTEKNGTRSEKMILRRKMYQ